MILEEGKIIKKKGDSSMLKKKVVAVLAIVLILGMASVAFAEDASAKAAGMWIFFAIAIACGFGIGIAALGTGLSMGNAINAALTGIARNPEASGKIQTNMIIGLALIESLCIYALVICFIMVFKIPDLGTVMQSLGV